MKIYFGLLILVSALYFGQGTSIMIPGTKYTMVPPKGFVISSNFSGFQNEETGASIIVMDMPTSYQELIQGFTKDALKTRGMELISKENVNYNDQNATLYKVSQKANGLDYLKQILIFGDKTKTVMVNGIYPVEAKDSEKEIYDALISLKYNEDQKSDPLDSARFSIDAGGTNYQFVKSLAGSLMYSEDGKIPSNKGLMIIANSLGNSAPSDQKQFSADRLKSLPNADKAKIKRTEKVTIAGMEGYETIAEGNDKQLLYQVMLFTADQYYLFVGEASNDQEKNLKVFQKVARTFKLK